ncbi:MAG TPA: ATP-binding protein [Chitinophagaceae bacterium]|nr:ATP-binding protein [Chitinophagaceae bacterium]
MRKYIFIYLIFIYPACSHAQNRNVDSASLSAINLPNLDSLEHLLTTKEEDTAKVNLLGRMSFSYAFNQADKAVDYGQRGVQLSLELGYKKGLAYCSQSLAWGLWGVGNYSNALQIAFKVLRLYEELEDEQQIAATYHLLANIYRDFGDHRRALVEVQKGSILYEKLNASNMIGYAITGSVYDLLNILDSASHYVHKAVELDTKYNQRKWGWLFYLQGNISRKMKRYDSAMFYYRTALPLVHNKDIVETYNGIAILYNETGRLDSGIFYASEVLKKWRYISYQRGILQAANILTGCYKKTNQRDSLIKYLEFSKTLNDSLFNQANERDIQNMAFNEQLRQDEILRERQQNLNRLKMYALAVAVLIFLIIALLFWRNNQHRKKAYALLQKQKQETDIQKTKAEQALTELKSAQSQLIQSEKMASLGELTAGIAHEIQNPLNFVNNFSEINTELADELEQEANKGNLDEVKSIVKDIKENEQKINHHGKRADAIVKGMLQHSRASSGQKELTDINALADEYLRLAYHGLRAKDKSFNAKFETDFDSSIGKISVVPQDIGRVILNLITNAFYACTELSRSAASLPSKGGFLESDNNKIPTVSVITKKDGNKVSISVRDNGSGIPKEILDKIFQPFFTTKPAGQGTGLGLSLSYDIVTKGHGGEIKVQTAEGEGTEFIVLLPL